MSLYEGKPEFQLRIGKDDFDRSAGPGNDLIPVDDVQKQIEELRVSAEKIEAYADKRVAHYDRKEPARPFPTFDDLTAIINVMERLGILYWRLLKGGSFTTLLPVFVFDWQDVFRFPWKPE